jgi:hypothetical protein
MSAHTTVCSEHSNRIAVSFAVIDFQRATQKFDGIRV